MTPKPWQLIIPTGLDTSALSAPLRARNPWRYRIVGDLFASLPFESIAAVLGVVAACPRHGFEVSTVNPGRARMWFDWADRLPMNTAKWCMGEAERLGAVIGATTLLKWPLANLRLLTHVTTQAEADARIPALLACPSVWRGVEVMPGERIDFRPWLSDDDGCEECDDNGMGGPGHCRRKGIPRCEQCPTTFAVFENDEPFTRKTLDLVTVRGGASPFHPDVVRDIRDQCAAARVPFRFEGWGPWFDLTSDEPGSDRHLRSVETRVILPSGEVVGAGYRIGRESSGSVAEDWKERGGAWMSRIGREDAGRLLDGVTHDGEVT